MSDWLNALRKECDRTSQGRTAKRLGVSATMINQALKGTYPGKLENLEERVRGELMHKTIDCPVLGEISSKICQDNQEKKFQATNPQRVALFKACRGGCNHYRGST